MKRVTASEYRRLVEQQPKAVRRAAAIALPSKRSKYGNVRTNGYASKMEAAYADALRESGAHWLEQVPLRLPGGVRYRVDFLVFCTDGTFEAVEVKGAVTDVGRIKILQARELYPWLALRVVRLKGGRWVEVDV